MHSPPFLSPTGRLLTPPTEKAQKWAEPHLQRAEKLERSEGPQAAAEAKAQALQEMMRVYQRAREHRQQRKLRAIETERATLNSSDTTSAQAIYLASDAHRTPLANLSNATPSGRSSNPASKRNSVKSSPSPRSASILSPSSTVSSISPRVPAMAGLSDFLPHEEAVALAAADAALVRGLPQEVLASVPEAAQPERHEPSEVQAVLISDATVVRHLQSRPFTLYRLFVPTTSGEHVAFRRYSDFLALDAQLRLSLGGGRADWLPCFHDRSLPRLPPKTAFWHDATAATTTMRRWGALQLYLDAALDAITVAQDEEAWHAFRAFLCLA